MYGEMRYGFEQLTEPKYEPVSVTDAKAFMRIDDTGDAAADAITNKLVASLIKAMREDAENLTFRAFVPRQYRLSLPFWPEDCEWGIKISFPFPPLITMDEFLYMDIAGNMNVLASNLYEVHTEYEPGVLVPAYLAILPSIRKWPNALRIKYTAGYTPGSPDDEAGYQSALPEKLKLWMQAKMSTLSEFREQILAGVSVAEMPRNYTDALLDSLIVGDRLA